MAKKKKKRFSKFKYRSKRKKTSSTAGKVQTGEAVQSLITTEQEKTSPTTFSTKLEEVISENQAKGKQGRRIILLSPPLGYSKEEWKKYLHNFWQAVLKFLMIVLALAVFVGLIVGIEYLADQHVFPRVSLAGENYGLLDGKAAQQKLIQQFEQIATGKLIVDYHQQNLAIPFDELGIKFDLDKTLAELPVFKMRRQNLLDLGWALSHGQKLPLQFSVDEQKIYQLIESKLNLTNQRAVNANFYFDEHKKLQIRTEKDGLMIDPEAFNRDLHNNLAQAVLVIKINTIDEKAKVKATDLEKFKDDLQLKIETPIYLKYQQHSWKFLPSNHLADIFFDKANDQVSIKFAESVITNFLQEKVFQEIETPVSDLKIKYDQTKQEVSFEGLAKNGLAVNHPKFLGNLELTVNSLDPDFEIPVEETKANVVIDQALQDMGIKELLSTGHTSFSGSPTNRRFNIKVAMARFNGLIIKPGETFSFNNYLGAVDGSTGYRLELVIKAEGTVPEFGGGVCQVSSTMFKAALRAGFPIVERSPHSYAVSYYAQVDGYGLDSTIYPGVRDLKFINDTGHNMLIQTFVDGDDAFINFFGTSDGRDVRLENYWRGNYRSAGGTELIPTTTLPTGAKKQIESAHGGFDASWDRVIYYNGQEKTRENIYSSYRATSNRILMGQ